MAKQKRYLRVRQQFPRYPAQNTLPNSRVAISAHRQEAGFSDGSRAHQLVGDRSFVINVMRDIDNLGLPAGSDSVGGFVSSDIDKDKRGVPGKSSTEKSSRLVLLLVLKLCLIMSIALGAQELYVEEVRDA